MVAAVAPPYRPALHAVHPEVPVDSALYVPPAQCMQVVEPGAVP